MSQDQDPREVTGESWLWADPDQLPEGAGDTPDYVGKWMLFIPPAEIRDTWARVASATRRGELGIQAKVATGVTNRDVLICVYTRDCRDLRDVAGVLARLRAMGFTGRLNYKEDLATEAMIYAGDKRGPASLYTSREDTFIKRLRPVTDSDSGRGGN